MDKEYSLKNYVLETERLYLRAFKKSDLNDLYEYASVEGVGELAGWPHHTDISISGKILNKFIEDEDVFAIVYKDNGKVIGSLGIVNYEKKLTGYENLSIKEIGYALSKEYWGKGLMTEAVKKAIEFAFTVLNIDILYCLHAATNDRSRRVIEKCGFEYAGFKEYEAKQLNITVESKQYLLFKDKYIAGKI